MSVPEKNTVTPKPSGDSIRVLILEDYKLFIELILNVLSTSGFSVSADVVQDEVEFMEQLRAEPYDVIVADYNLPRWSGRAALLLRNEHWASIPFIFLTGSQGDYVAAECMREGATDYLLKNQLARLPHAIHRALKETRDIAERKRAEAALRQSEERYRLIFDHSPLPMWIYEPETLRFLEVNQAAVDQYGYSHDEFLRMTLKDIRPAEDVPLLLERLSEGTQREGIWRHLRKNGEIGYVEIKDVLLSFEERQARLVLIHDITERKRAIDALKASEREYRSIIEGAPYGIYRVREDGEIVMANAAMARILGYESSADLVGRNVIPLFYSDQKEVDRLTAEWRGVEAVGNLESTWRNKEGNEIVVRLVGRSLPKENFPSPTFEIFVEDITDQRALEQQFRQAQKMEAVGRLAGGVAHDFNNLLMVIGSCATLISETTHDVNKVQKYSKQIADAASQAAAVTRQLLAFSRKQVLQPLVLNPNTLALKLSSMLQRLLGEDISLTLVTKAEGKVRVDPTQLEQVVMNLAVNARDAMPNGGQLIIETSDTKLDFEYAKQHAVELPPGEYVMLAVTDTGSGMDPETQARIFEPFFTTKGPDKGTGLGLSTVYGIVKQSGGFVWAYSEVGKGSTFKVYLPRVRGAEETGEISSPAAVSTRGTETILLVEDEAALRAVTREYLVSLGYSVLEAKNGEQALEMVRNFQQQIHVLITDMVMPGLGGPQLASEALALRPDLRVIYASGYTDRSIDRSLIGANATFLQKPFGLGVLASTVRRLLEKNTA